MHAVVSISTHVLDTSLGRPATGMEVALEHENGSSWVAVGRGATDDDGRVRSLVPDGATAPAGIYRLVFETGAYFVRHGVTAFYPSVVVVFETRDGHYHVPLLLSPYGYSTYRGS